MGGWRKGWDSNPRYPCRHAGFQDRCLKPLGHPSAAAVQSLSKSNIKNRIAASPLCGAGDTNAQQAKAASLRLFALGQPDGNMGRAADHARTAIAMVLVLDEGFEVQKELFGEHREIPLKRVSAK